MSKKFLCGIFLLGIISISLTALFIFSNAKSENKNDNKKETVSSSYVEKAKELIQEKHTITYTDDMDSYLPNMSNSATELMLSNPSMYDANVNAALLKKYSEQYSVNAKNIEAYKSSVETTSEGIRIYWYQDATNILKVTIASDPSLGDVAYLDIVE